MGIGSRYCSEFKVPFFGVKEEHHGTLDMGENFNMGKGIKSVITLFKVFLLAFALAALGIAYKRHPETQFYPAYLTMWGVVWCILYLGGSLFLAIRGDYEPNRHNFAIEFTWVFFSVAAVQGICIAILYWGFVWIPGREVDINNTMTHGGCLLMVLVDGLLINRIPLRIKHNVITAFLAVLYITWSVIQNVVWKYNPVHDDDDDALYDVLKWREETASAIIMTCIILFGAIPLFSSILWAVSLPGRHYEKNEQGTDDYNSDNNSNIKVMEDEEMGDDGEQVSVG